MRAAGLALAGVVLIGACASGPLPTPGPQVTVPLSIGGSDYEAVWGLPAGPAIGLAVIQHGFTRQCRHLAGVFEALVARGVVTLCVDTSMAGGQPALADALAELLAGGLSTPGGVPVPARVIVGGHSAGGAFAARLGAGLARRAPHRLAGALLFDPVAVGSFSTDLRALSAQGTRPVRTVSASAGACNAHNNAYPALRMVRSDAVGAGRDAFVGVELTDRSTHVDAEGEYSDLLTWAACRQGRPDRANVLTLRALAAGWAADLLLDIRTPAIHPEGAWLETLRAQGRAAFIE